jgi:anti-sigma factor RsiW
MEGRSDMEMEILLSAYCDGEASADERKVVEQALAQDPRLRARLADLQATSALVQASLEREADQVDFSSFADSVMERVAPVRAVAKVESPSLWARFTAWLDDLFAHHRLQVTAALTVAVVLLVAGPLLWNQQQQTTLESQGPLLAGGADMASVIDLATPEDTDAMIINTASGTTVIYVQGN